MQSCSIFLGRLLTPIHESAAPEMQQSETQESEADMVFYSETSHPANDSSTTELLSTYNKNSSIVLAEDSSDSGVAHGDLDNGVTLNDSPPNSSSDPPLVFNVSFSPDHGDEESTEC